MGLFTDQLTDQQLLPPMANRNAQTRPALAQMDKLFLAVVAIGLIVLIAAGMLFATAPKRTTSFRAPYPISQQRH